MHLVRGDLRSADAEEASAGMRCDANRCRKYLREDKCAEVLRLDWGEYVERSVVALEAAPELVPVSEEQQQVAAPREERGVDQEVPKNMVEGLPSALKEQVEKS